MRPCGDALITAFVADGGHTCAVVSVQGVIRKWVTIEAKTARKFGGWLDTDALRMTRLATLGSPEVMANCGSDARFLMGYETAEVSNMKHYPAIWRKRWLVELDGDCNRMTEPMEVTDFSLWPINEEWTTTQDGAVVWVTAWKWRKLWNGSYAPVLSTVESTYEPRPVRGSEPKIVWQWGSLYANGRYWGNGVIAENGGPGKEKLIFNQSADATSRAVLSIYYPAGKMPSRDSLTVHTPERNQSFHAFGWRLLVVPTKGGSSKWHIDRLIFQTMEGALGENEECTAVSGYWYGYPLRDSGPQGAFTEVGSWIGTQDGNNELWVGIQCQTEQPELMSVSYQEGNAHCRYFPENDGPLAVSAFLALWSGSEWLEVAELPLDNPSRCGNLREIWNAALPYKSPQSF